MGPRQNGAPANWAPSDFLRQIGPRQIGPRQIRPRQIGPRQIGPDKLCPANFLVLQIGPRIFSPANWDPANWAPHPPPLPTPCMAKDNNFVKHYNVFTTMKKSFYVNYMLPKGLQNYTKFASEWKAFPYGSPTQMQTLFGHCPWGRGVSTLARMGWENFHPK